MPSQPRAQDDGVEEPHRARGWGGRACLDLGILWPEREMRASGLAPVQ